MQIPEFLSEYPGCDAALRERPSNEGDTKIIKDLVDWPSKRPAILDRQLRSTRRSFVGKEQQTASQGKCSDPVSPQSQTVSSGASTRPSMGWGRPMPLSFTFCRQHGSAADESTGGIQSIPTPHQFEQVAPDFRPIQNWEAQHRRRSPLKPPLRHVKKKAEHENPTTRIRA